MRRPATDQFIFFDEAAQAGGEVACRDNGVATDGALNCCRYDGGACTAANNSAGCCAGLVCVGRVETTKGFIGAKKVGVVAAGHSSVIMQMAGLRMPLESYPLQALVSEPVKPVFPCVVMSNTVHAYISQSDKGELVIGAGTDQYYSYSQTGGLHILNHTLDAICEMFPIFGRMKMLRSWGGIVDVTPDRSPILAKTPVPGLYVNCGWGTGGFKATPGSGHVFAHTIARDEPHPIAAPYTLERFRTGRLIDEAAAAAVAH
jgi:sarcosine oxidase, subunit beta